MRRGAVTALLQAQHEIGSQRPLLPSLFGIKLALVRFTVAEVDQLQAGTSTRPGHLYDRFQQPGADAYATLRILYKEF